MDAVPDFSGLHVVLDHDVEGHEEAVVPEAVGHSLQIHDYANLIRIVVTQWPIFVMRSSCSFSISMPSSYKFKAMRVE